MHEVTTQNFNQVILIVFNILNINVYLIIIFNRSKKFEDNSQKLDSSVDKTTIEICVNAIDKHLNELNSELWSKNTLKSLETKLLFLEKRSNEIPVCINNC